MPHSLSEILDPVVLVAFEGWNDAADAATDLLKHITSHYESEVLFEIDGEEYYDFTVQRPTLVRPTTDDPAHIEWPSTRVLTVRLPDRDLVVVMGPEPNCRWRGFVQSVVSALRSAEPSLVIVLGAMLTDSPHSRPLPVWSSTENTRLSREYGITASEYEGLIGVTGVLADACERAGLPVVSVWASVPHYVASTPTPKATLALLNRVESLMDVTLEQGELPELARAWERGVNELTGEDPDVAEYVAQLEAHTEESDLPQASGESIAADFQRYLRRRNQQD